jgi:hypothetical protein
VQEFYTAARVRRFTHTHARAVVRNSTRVDLLRGVFNERTFSSGEIAKIRRQALAGAVSGKIGLPERARSNANALVDILPLPILHRIEVSLPKVIRQGLYVVVPSCLSRGEPRRVNALRYVDSS